MSKSLILVLATGSQLLTLALKDFEGRVGVVDAYLHVQVSNTDAIGFYMRRGFHIAQTLQNYYRRIQPAHAVLLRKPFQEAQAQEPKAQTLLARQPLPK